MERNQVTFGLLIFILLGFVQTYVTAQELIFEKNPGTPVSHPNLGPNRKYFFCPFISTSLKLSLPPSGQAALGLRFKYKLSQPLSFVSELGVENEVFNINRQSGLVLIDTVNHGSQSIKAAGVFGGIFIRARIGQKGDYLGNYIDFGISGQSYIVKTLITRDAIERGNQTNIVSERTDKTRFKELNPLSYSVCIRIGFDKFSLMASYRLSRLMKIKSGNDLPSFELGLDYSLFRY